jgi:hypothetical protein
MIPYARYCADLQRFNQPIIFSEDEYERKYGELIREEKLVELRKKELTLRLAILEPKATLKKPPKSIIVKAFKELYKAKRKTDRVMTPKVSHASMSIEELKAHKAELARAWRAKRKEEGKLKTRSRTDEDREAYSDYKKEWYINNKERVKAQCKEYRDTHLDKEANRAKMREWRAKNPEKAREISKRSKANQKEKRNATLSTSD